MLTNWQRIRIALWGLSAVFLVACQPNLVDGEQDGVLRIGGSTTLLPILSTAASDFMEKYETWDKVDSSLPDNEIVIFVSGGGSSFGVRSSINGTVHIGLASRDLKDKEKELLGNHQSFLVGKDAVVIATNVNNPIAALKDGFTSDELALIMSGEYDTFQSIDNSLAPEEIVLFVRDSGAGSAEIIQNKIMGERQISPHALQLASQGALLKKLESNEYGIAYISSGLVLESDVLKAYSLDGVEPTNENFISGQYSLVRPLLMLVKGEPSVMQLHFIDYVLNEGQKIVESNNYVPVIEIE